MQAFKVDHYEREHGLGTFVPFRHLADSEASAIREFLKRCLKLPLGSAPSEIVEAVFSKSAYVEGINAEQAGFDLMALLKRLQFAPSELAYLNWYQYDDIDEIKTHDLANMFSDIWYPSSDELDVIDSKMRWIVSIHHSGTIRAWRIAKA